MATGSCAVVVWMQRPERIDLVIAPSLYFNINAQVGRLLRQGSTADVHGIMKTPNRAHAADAMSAAPSP